MAKMSKAKRSAAAKRAGASARGSNDQQKQLPVSPLQLKRAGASARRK